MQNLLKSPKGFYESMVHSVETIEPTLNPLNYETKIRLLLFLILLYPPWLLANTDYFNQALNLYKKEFVKAKFKFEQDYRKPKNEKVLSVSFKNI